MYWYYFKTGLVKRLFYQVIDICRIPKIVSSPDWNSECSPRFEALLSTRRRPVHLLLPLPCPPASTSSGEGRTGGSSRARTFIPDSEIGNAHPKAVYVQYPSTSEITPFYLKPRITRSEKLRSVVRLHRVSLGLFSLRTASFEVPQFHYL